jgi:hypothetical protein
MAHLEFTCILICKDKEITEDYFKEKVIGFTTLFNLQTPQFKVCLETINQHKNPNPYIDNRQKLFCADIKFYFLSYQIAYYTAVYQAFYAFAEFYGFVIHKKEVELIDHNT